MENSSTFNGVEKTTNSSSLSANVNYARVRFVPLKMIHVTLRFPHAAITDYSVSRMIASASR